MALLEDLQNLLAVQTIDTQIDRARAAIAALDTGQSTVVAYNAAKAQAESLRTDANKAQAEQKDAEMRLSTVEEKIVQVDKTFAAGKVTATRELVNLQQEREMLVRQRGDAEEKVLLAMEAANEAVTTAEAAELKQAKLASRYKKIRAAYKEEHTRLSEEIAVHDKERAVAIKPVPAALLTRYDGIRSKKAGIGAAPLNDDGTCGACHTGLNAGLVGAVLVAATPQVCEYCARILVPVPK